MLQSNPSQRTPLFTIRFHPHRPNPAHHHPPLAHTHSLPALSPLTPLPPSTRTPHVSSPSPPSHLLSPPALPAHTLSLPQKMLGQWREPLLDPHSLNQQQTGRQNIQLSRSLIESLLDLSTDSLAAWDCPVMGLQAVETQSIGDEDDEYLSQHSEVLALTEEEKNFFNNFIVRESSQSLEDSIFKDVRVVETESRVVPCSQGLSERKRVIRNFFRPKGSFLKDERTSCNSTNSVSQLGESARQVRGGERGCGLTSLIME